MDGKGNFNLLKSNAKYTKLKVENWMEKKSRINLITIKPEKRAIERKKE